MLLLRCALNKFTTAAKNRLAWLRRILRWLGEPKPLWIGLLGLLAAPFIGGMFADWKPDDSVRYTGLALQVAGLLLVAVEIVKRRKEFPNGGLWMAFKDWLKRGRAVFRGDAVVVAVAAQAIASATAQAHATVGLGPQATVWQHIEKLQREIDQASRQLFELEGRVDSDLSALKRSVTQEREERLQGERRLEGRIADLSVDWLYFEWVGFVWFLCGEVLSSLGPELAGPAAAVLRWVRLALLPS